MLEQHKTSDNTKYNANDNAKSNMSNNTKSNASNSTNDNTSSLRLHHVFRILPIRENGHHTQMQHVDENHFKQA